MKARIMYFLTLVFLPSIPSFALDKFEVDGITYEVNSSTSVNGVLTKANVSVTYGTQKYSGDIVIPEKIIYNNFTYTVDKIAYYSFRDCEDLTSVIIPSSITYIGSSAFENCNKLTTLSIPNSVKEFGNGAINKCSGIKNPIYNASHFIYMPENYEGVYSIPDGIEYVIAEAFDDCENLTNVIFPNSVKEIGSYCFWGCEKLSKVELNEGLKTISRNSFYGASKLEDIKLPSTLTEIGYSAFYNTGIKSVYIPATVEAIDGNPFIYCNQLESISVDENNKTFNSRNNCNAILKGNELCVGCKNTIVPEGTESISKEAFYYCSELASIALPESVISIGESAFRHCSNLVSVELGEGLKTISKNSFYGASKLEDIKLPSTLTEIGYSAFYNTGIKSVYIPATVEAIDGNPFSNCKRLESISVDENNKTFNSRNNCNAILKGNELCVGCKNTIVPEGTESISEEAFYYCSELASIALPQSVISIGESAFANCYNLVSVELGEGLKTISKDSFRGTSKLESIILPSTLTEIGDNAFYGSGLKNIISKISTPFVINKNVFDYNNRNLSCYNNAILYVNEGKVSVYKETEGWKEFKNIQEKPVDLNFADGTFSYTLSQILKTGTIIALNTDNENIIIPETVQCQGTTYSINKIKDGVFANKKLVTITFPEKQQILGLGLFEGSDNLSAIIWNRSDRPSDELIRSIKSPNVLFYTKSENAAPNNLNNVIVNNVAKNIVLVDAPQTNFYCPQEFHTENITYTHTYSLKTEKGICEGWESIALPFDVQTYMTTDGEAKPFKIACPGEKLFWLREYTASGMVEAEGIKANVPYIISMPNWDGYQDFYNIQGDVVFSAQDVIITKTEVNPVSIYGRSFWPCYQSIEKSHDIFVLNKEGITFSNSNTVCLPGSSFLGNLRNTRPFEAYFTYNTVSAAREIPISELLNSPSTIETIVPDYSISINGKEIDLVNNNNPFISIYSQTGQIVKNVPLSRGNIISIDLPTGIYIVNGTKVLVK